MQDDECMCRYGCGHGGMKRVVDDGLKVMGMTMGMNRDGVMWARDEHERGMNVMQPCMV